MPKHLKNISNHLSIVDDVSEALEYIMNGNSEGIFGLEIQLSDGVMSKLLVTPPYIRLGLQIPDSSIIYDDKELTVYEGYLAEPHFLPIYTGLTGELLDELEKLIIKKNDLVEMQWLFRRKSDSWKDGSIDMYGSYLEGNDYPFSSRLGRKIQDKVLGWLNKIGSFETKKEYIDEVETKLLSQGFQFQLRVLIQSDSPEAVKDQLEEVFKRYDSHNALRLYKQKDKRFKTMYKERVLSYDTQSQILSRNEIVSLFGGNAPIVETVEDTVKENKVEVVETAKNTKATDIISLLPEYPRQDVMVDPNIVSNLAEAMKRIGLITQARLYNESVIAGIRLTVVQCDIPRGKTLTQIASKSKDIQAALGVQSLSIEQGEEADTVKFAIPNEKPSIVSLRELIELKEFQEYAAKNPLSFIVGVDEINNPIFLSLTKLVHLLVAGASGSGKSVFLNSLIICLMTTLPPQLLRLVMIDPKQVELQQYGKGFPHVASLVTDMNEAEGVLKQLVSEMERRYTTFSDVGVKNIALYNQKVEKKMAYIVCVIDEYADLKDTNPKAEDYITRLGQKARAAGIHIIIGTQRPDKDVVSGRIKANIQNVISFNLGNVNHYRTCFAQNIPYQLLGRGDGVMKIEGYHKTFQRFQSAIISPDESQEEKVFEDMRNYFANYKSKPLPTEEIEEKETVQEDDTLNKLKRIIAQTGETKVEPLRNALGVKSATMTELMQQLVDDGFLIRHKSKAKGYEIAVDETELEKWIQ